MNDEAAKVLSLTSDEALLRTYAALTHRLHATRDIAESSDLRWQRDRVEAEILRRMK